MTPTPCNPLGAKGVGEAGTLGSTPCIVSAAVDALSPFGVKHIDMMLRPEKLWRIIQAVAKGGRHDSGCFRLRTRHLDRRCDREARAPDGGKLIAGGHSLVPLMKLRLSEPGRLVDIARIPGLSGIKEVGGRIEIGATTVHSDIAGSKLLRDKCPMIAEAAARSAIRKSGIAARSAAASRTPIRQRTFRR